ncbi:MAG: hypothetical protein WD404_02760 [Solirubrobacterales bacterium]
MGVIEAFALIALLTVCCAHFARSLDYASPELCYSLAGIGMAILLGYVVESVWMVNRAKRNDFHEYWLGNICGAGLAGLTGVASAVLVAAHREGGGGSLLDDLGIWWSAWSLGLLGVLVTLHPLVVDRWSRQDEDD